MVVSGTAADRHTTPFSPSMKGDTWDWNCRQCGSLIWIYFGTEKTPELYFIFTVPDEGQHLAVWQSSWTKELFYCSKPLYVWPFRALPIKMILFFEEVLVLSLSLHFLQTFNEIENANVRLAEPIGRNWLAILRMSLWLFIFNLHWGSLFNETTRRSNLQFFRCR